MSIEEEERNDTAKHIFYRIPLRDSTHPDLPRPELNFSVQRATFGASSNVTSICEKFSLLSQPCSYESFRILKRCFSMQIVRGKMAKALEKQRKKKKRRLPWRVVLGSATTGALPKNFAGVFKSEDLWQRVWNGVYECRPVHSLSSRMLVLKNGPLLLFL